MSWQSFLSATNGRSILFGSALLIGIWGGDFLKAVAHEFRHPQPRHRRFQ
jgi:hypothetical protein